MHVWMHPYKYLLLHGLECHTLRPLGFTSLLYQYLLCGTRKAHVITSLLYEQVAKDLLLYCVPKKTPKSLLWVDSTAFEEKNKLLDFRTYLDQRQT